MADAIRHGVIGLAGRGSSHIDVLDAIDGVELAAGSDVVEEHVAAFEEEHGVPGYADHEEMLAAEDVDSVSGPAKFVPDHPAVLASIPTIESGERKQLEFSAPDAPGIYPYVCTYPGHGYTMYGAMYVGRQELPPLSEDPNLPARHAEQADRSEGNDDGLDLPHAFTARRPFVYRIKMPDATQAAIAVALRNGQNYCWDAGRGRLRYAWSGGFVDPMPNFSGKGAEPAEVKGKIYYRSTTVPIRIGSPDSTPTPVSFLGYQMNAGRPAFEYEIDGVRVRELITPLPGGDGIRRLFRVEGLDQPLWFVTAPEGAVQFSSPDGTFDRNGRLKLSPDAARRFRVDVEHSPSSNEEK